MMTLAEGGSWCIPRSALVFRKYGRAMVLVGSMPHHDLLPMTAAEWENQQAEEYRLAKQMFEAAGFEMRRSQ